MQRPDGMPDLNNWQEYLKKSDCRSLGEMFALRATKRKNSIEDILLSKAIDARKNEIADAIIKNLCREGLSIQSAIVVLEHVHKKIMETKVSP